MADLDVEVHYRDWDDAIVALGRRMGAATFTAGQQSMFLVERNVKFYLRTYTHKEGTPTPSPRGGPPALVTGGLARSWRNEKPTTGADPYVVRTRGGPTIVYARIHELSGQAGRGLRTHIPARPYVRPMLLVSRRGIRRIHISAWTGAIRAV